MRSYEFAAERMRQGTGDRHVDIGIDERALACKVDHPVVRRPRGELRLVLDRSTRHEDTLLRSDHGIAARTVLRVEQRLQARKTRLLDLRKNLLRQLRGGRTRSRAVREAEGTIETDVLH